MNDTERRLDELAELLDAHLRKLGQLCLVPDKDYARFWRVCDRFHWRERLSASDAAFLDLFERRLFRLRTIGKWLPDEVEIQGELIA